MSPPVAHTHRQPPPATVASPALRDERLDVIRAAAVARVVLWHTTGWVVCTYIAAVPVMFAVTGFLLASTAARAGVWRTLWRRLTTLLPTFWWFAAAVCMAMVVVDHTAVPDLTALWSWVLPVRVPPASVFESGWVTGPLWYIRTYLHIVLAAPLALRAARRFPVHALISLAMVLVVLRITVPNVTGWHDFVLYQWFALAGMTAAVHPAARRLALDVHRPVLAAAVAVAACYAVLAPTQTGAVNDDPLLHGIVGIATLCGCIAVRQWCSFVKMPRLVRAVAEFCATKSLTVYLWHAPVFALAFTVAAPWVPNRASSTLLALCATAAVLPLVARLERTRQGRRTVSHSRRPLCAPVAAFATVSVLAVAFVAAPPVSSSTPAASALPRPPSVAPPVALFDDAHSPLLAAPSSVIAAPTPSTTIAHAPKRATAPTAPATTVRPVPALLDLDAFEATVTALVEEYATTEQRSVEVHVRVGDRTIKAAATKDGRADPTTGQVELYSVSKSFTAALLLTAAANGRIGLHEPIGRLTRAPWFTKTEDITLFQLLSHRTGLANYMDQAMLDTGLLMDDPLVVLEALESVPPQFTPGTKQSYSSSNYVVAGLLVEQVYGVPVESAVRQYLLAPLGLTATTSYPPSRFAPGTGTGNMRSSFADLLAWGHAMYLTESVLPPTAATWARAVDPKSLIGPAGFAFCPCKQTAAGFTAPAAWGMNGANLSLRAYRTAGIVLVGRTDGAMSSSFDRLLTDIATAATRR